MTPTQREAALRLTNLYKLTAAERAVWINDAHALLRELAAEPVQEPVARPPTPAGWSDTDWIRHLECSPPIGYAVRDTLYGTSTAGVLRFCPSTEIGAFAVYAAPQQRKAEPVQDVPEAGFGNSEPVAWRVRHDQSPGYWVIFQHFPVDAMKDPQRHVESLYAAPQQRKPLTDEQIKALVLETVMSDATKPVELRDPELDIADPHTRLLVLAEYWKDKCSEARIERDELRYRCYLYLDAFDEHDICDSFAGLPVEYFNPGPDWVCEGRRP